MLYYKHINRRWGVIPVDKRISLKRLVCVTALITALLLTILIPSVPRASAAFGYFYYLSAPVIDAPSNTDKGVRISWTHVAGAVRYRVYVQSGATWSVLGETTENSMYHKDAESGKTYSYCVYCINANGSFFTSDSSAVKSIAYIAAPKITKLSALSDGVRISWDAVSGAKTYRVFVYDNKWKNICETGETSCVYRDVIPGGTYKFTVRSLSGDGKTYNSGYDKEGASTTFVKTPDILSFTDEPGGVRITWDACAGAEVYRLYKRIGDQWTRIAVTSATSYLHSVVQDEENVYTVRCFDGHKNGVSDYNREGWRHRYHFEGSVGEPAITGVLNTQAGAKIYWMRVTGAQRYRVLLKTGDGWTVLGETDGNHFTHTSAASGVSFTYSVCCIDSSGSACSNYASAYSNTYYRSPDIKSVINTANGPLITWNTSPGAAYYRLLARKGGVRLTLGVTAKTSFLHRTAADNTLYSYTVDCLDSHYRPVSETSEQGCDNVCSRSVSYRVYSCGIFASDIKAATNAGSGVVREPNAPLTRASAAQILVDALGYKHKTSIRLSDATNNEYLQTAAYYGYFLPDGSDRIYPESYVTEAEYNSLMTELSRYAQLKGKRILAFGDSIVVGKGNNAESIARIMGEKYSMKYKSYARNGATLSSANDVRRHIADQTAEAYESGFKPDIILLNGGTNDISLVWRENEDEYFDPYDPDSSTLAAGMNRILDDIFRYWSGVPVIFIRAHNLNVYDDTLERQIGEYTVSLAKRRGCHIADVFSETGFNTETGNIQNRYTVDVDNPSRGDSIHPNALGYATFYMPLIYEKTAQLLLP